METGGGFAVVHPSIDAVEAEVWGRELMQHAAAQAAMEVKSSGVVYG